MGMGMAKQIGEIPSSSSENNGIKQYDGQRATIVVLGVPQPELISHADGFSSLLLEGGDYAEVTRTRQSSLPLGSDDHAIQAQNAKPTSNGYPPFFGGGSFPVPDIVSDTFKLDALGGLDEEIRYLRRAVILPWVRPKVFNEWGVKPPKGILLHGPPGTGKTFMAKSLVNEIRKHNNGKPVNFFYRKGGDVFSMWFGESQRKLREVFSAAKESTPSVIFFDEIDGLCPSRDRPSLGTEAYSSVVTCFLGQMDDIENGKVFVIAATNRLDAVDPAVRRPGRFDKQLAFGFPDAEGRRKILGVHLGKWDQNDRPSNEYINDLAQKTIGFSGADLEKLCKDAVYTAMEENGGQITNEMKVTEDHWMKAMRSMRRTASNIYGSYVITPNKPSDIVSALIRPTVTSAIKIIEKLVGPNGSFSPSFTKSFLIAQTSAHSKSFLNNQILQGILSDPILNKWTLYDLSLDTISNKVLSGKPSALSVVNDVINQALNSDNPSVVVVPNINELIAIGEASKLGFWLLNALEKLRGPNILLLATSSQCLTEFKGNEKQVLKFFIGINRHLNVDNPRKEQLKVFFNEIFTTTKRTRQTAQKWEIVAERAAEVSDNDNFEDILNLYNELSMAFPADNLPFDLTNSEKKFDEILNLYSQNKLH